MNSMQVIDEREVLGKDFRIYGDTESPLFLAKDIAEWIEHTDVSTMLRTVDDGEKLTQTIFVSGQNREHWFLTEDGFYEVLMQSRKPIAKEFKKQVKQILREIRRHGIYATDNVIEQILNNPDFGIELLTTLKTERQKRLKAEQTNNILMHVNKTYTATEIAKELGFKSATELNARLAEQKIQYKQNNTWVLYSKYASRGYVHIKQDVLDNGKVIYHRRWTQLGREFLVRLFTHAKKEAI